MFEPKFITYDTKVRPTAEIAQNRVVDLTTTKAKQMFAQRTNRELLQPFVQGTDSSICGFAVPLALSQRTKHPITNYQAFVQAASSFGVLDKGGMMTQDEAKISDFIDKQTGGTIKAVHFTSTNPQNLLHPPDFRNPNPEPHDRFPTETVLFGLKANLYMSMLYPVGLDQYNRVQFEWFCIDDARLIEQPSALLNTEQKHQEVLYHAMWSVNGTTFPISLPKMVHDLYQAARLGYGTQIWGWKVKPEFE